MGAERDPASNRDEWVTACHEAGHAAAAAALGLAFERVSLRPAGDSAGRVAGIRFPDPGGDPGRAEEYLVYLFAGGAAVRELLGRRSPAGDTDDRHRAEQYAGLAFPAPAEYVARLRRAAERARQLARERRAAIERLAAALLDRRELTAAEAAAVLGGT